MRYKRLYEDMSYPGQFVRLVMIGTLYSNEQFNMTLSIVPSALGELGMPAVDAPTLAAVAANCSSWFNSTAAGTGPSFLAEHKLVSIKLNRLGTDGRYVDNLAMEHVYPSPIAGGGSAPSGKPAPQLAHVVSLRTAIERGRGSKGRIYLPGNVAIAGVASDGRITAANALVGANAVKALINSLNATYTLIGKVGIASNAGTGRFEHVTRVAAGRVVDTMRSRRASLLEDYQEVVL